MKCKIQVVICGLCSKTPEVLDTGRLASIAADTSMVASVMVVDKLCNPKTVKEIVQEARVKEVDRAVVLPCPRRDVTPLLVAAYGRVGVHDSLVEMVNLVEEVLLPHRNDREGAQAKAEAMLRAALARMTALTPLEKTSEDMRTKNDVIIGAGASGLEAASVASGMGAHTILLEKTGKSLKAPDVLLSSARLVGAAGYGGNFTLTIEVGEVLEELQCAAIVVATGGGWTQLRGPLAKTCKGAKTIYELHGQTEADDAAVNGPLVVVDTPDPKGATMKAQDFAWEETLDVVVRLKRARPEVEIWVVFQEMRAFGLAELTYKEACDLGVRFVRYAQSSPPKIDPGRPDVLNVKDLAQDETVAIRFGTIAFASIPPNPDNQLIADILRLPMSEDGAIRRGSVQRGPVSTPRPGIFVCGSALFPKTHAMAVTEGRAAGAMAGEFAMRGTVEYGGSVAVVDPDKCSACLTCVRTCPYEAPFFGETGKAEIRQQLCQGCGMCAGICPSKAIQILNRTDDQIRTEASTLIGGVH
ncbi:MAG: 4Fe-4S binding protein [Thermoplasmata archaeon]|nr:4Fe-4S binding protein [Thermoplasmata archaeon]